MNAPLVDSAALEGNSQARRRSRKPRAAEVAEEQGERQNRLEHTAARRARADTGKLRSLNVLRGLP
jgi:hypothetical protein